MIADGSLALVEGFDSGPSTSAFSPHVGPVELDVDRNLRNFLLSGPKADRQRTRQREALSIARGLAGDQVAHLELVEMEGRPALLDRSTGEIIEAGPGEARALRFALMHMLGADPANHAVGVVEEVHENGRKEFHEEGTAQTRHSSRLNTNYIEAMRRRNRGNARRAVLRGQGSMTPGEWYQHRHPHMRGRLAWSLLTLTLPPVEGALFLLEIQRFNRAFDLFRKREPWREKVRAGIKGVEMKLSVFMGQIRIHAHGHMLMLSRWWDWRSIRREWLACVDQATEDIYGVRLDIEALEAQVEGGVVTDIRTVKSRHHDGDIELEDALQETLKYVTKPDDWEALVEAGQVGRGLLLEMEEIKQWPRMFELLGAARQVRNHEADPAAAEGGRGFLDTACVNDGKAKGPDEDRPMEGALPGLLDPPAGSLKGPEAVPEVSPRPPPAARPPSWRELMDELPLGEWVAAMVARMKSARRFIARLILERRGGIWTTLDGRALGAGEPERFAEPIRKAPRVLPGMDPLGDLWAGAALV